MQAAAALVPHLFHTLLQERVYKGTYEPSSVKLQLATPAALCCFVLTAIAAAASLALSQHRQAATAKRNLTQLPCSVLSLAIISALDAVSLVLLNQAIVAATVPSVLLAAALLSAVAQLAQTLAKPEHRSLAALSPGHCLLLIGFLTYACLRRTLPFGAYNSSPFTFSAFVLVSLHVAFAAAATAVRKTILNAAAAQSQRPNTSDRQHLILCSSTLSAIISFVMLLLSRLFIADPPQWALPRNASLHVDLLMLGAAFALSTLAASHLQTGTEGNLQQLQRLAAMPFNATALGYFQLLGAAAWLGVGWVAAGLTLIALGASLDLSAQGFVQLPISAASSPAEKGTTIFTSPNSPAPDYDEPELDTNKPKSAWTGISALLTATGTPLLLALCIVASSRFLGPLDLHSSLQLAQTQDTAVIEGTQWAVTAHAALRPECPHQVSTERYERTHLHTALATFPRSGNSWTRMLIERASGYRTSTLYCDGTVEDVFLDDCYHDGKFMEKTHYPYLGDEYGWTRYEKAIRPVRNPLDACYSFWHFWQSINEDNKNHTARVQLDHPLGQLESERKDLLSFAQDWVAHDSYWHSSPIQQFVIRYEDLRRNTLSNLLAMLAFFVPPQDLPPLAQVTCALELNKGLQPYNSAKREFFYSWDKLEAVTRTQMLQITKVPFCKHGYDHLFKELMPLEVLPIDCDQIRLEAGPPKPQ